MQGGIKRLLVVFVARFPQLEHVADDNIPARRLLADLQEPLQAGKHGAGIGVVGVVHPVDAIDIRLSHAGTWKRTALQSLRDFHEGKPERDACGYCCGGISRLRLAANRPNEGGLLARVMADDGQAIAALRHSSIDGLHIRLLRKAEGDDAAISCMALKDIQALTNSGDDGNAFR